MDPTPGQPKRSGGFLRIFSIVCAVIIVLGGVAKMWRGIQGMRGGNSAEFTKLLEESDHAVEEASRLSGEARPLFQALLDNVDRLGLDAFRAQQKEAAAKTSALYASSAEQFKIARTKLDQATPLNKNEALTPFLASKSRSYDSYAQVVSLNQEIVRLTGDQSITTMDVLLPKLREVAARRDAAEKSGQAASQEADEIGAQISGKPKK